MKRSDIDPQKTRSHSKITLYDIVMSALDNSKDSGLEWTVPNKEFGLNTERFTDYYQKMAGSTAKGNSILNRMTKSKSGFVALNHMYNNNNYDKIYTHATWQSGPTLNKKNNINIGVMNPTYVCEIGNISNSTIDTQNNTYVQPHNTYVQPHNTYIQPQNNTYVQPHNTYVQPHNNTQSQNNIQQNNNDYQNTIDIIFNPEILPVTILNNQPNVFKDAMFNLSQFVDDLRSNQHLYMTDYDKVNFKFLFWGELGCVETVIVSTNILHDFGVRFGPWINIVKNITEFVSNGAKKWYHGKCDTQTAINILSRCPSDHEYFLIRTVDIDSNTIPQLKYVFAISYRKINGGIAHQKIYKDTINNLCLINDKNELEIFSNFEEIIQNILKDPHPVSNVFFTNLANCPSEKICINDIINEPDFERFEN
jgi:hypothetical protein